MKKMQQLARKKKKKKRILNVNFLQSYGSIWMQIELRIVYFLVDACLDRCGPSDSLVR